MDIQFTEEELAFKPASSVETYQLVGSLGGWLQISGRRGTSLIDVRVNHPDAEAARVIADTLLKVYLEKEESQLIGGSDDKQYDTWLEFSGKLFPTRDDMPSHRGRNR